MKTTVKIFFILISIILLGWCWNKEQENINSKPIVVEENSWWIDAWIVIPVENSWWTSTWIIITEENTWWIETWVPIPKENIFISVIDKTVWEE